MRALRLSTSRSSIREARHFVLDAAGDLPDPDAVALLASELVTNVLRHMPAELEVRVRRSQRVRVEVRAGAAAPKAYKEMMEVPVGLGPAVPAGQRGLALVRALAADVGLLQVPGGDDAVWFEI